jgi:Tfp pilus assembly protein PilO
MTGGFMPTLTETIMKSSKVSRVVASASIVLIVGLLTYNWAVSPQASYLQAAQRYETVAESIGKKTKIMSNAVRVKKIKIKKLRDSLRISGSNFFSNQQAEELFSQLGNISTLAGCNFESIVFAKETSNLLDEDKPEISKVIEKQARVKVVGTYGEIVSFTSALKDYPSAIYTSDLMIELKNSETGKLSCSMNLKIYLTEDKELLLDKDIHLKNN